MKKYSDSEIVLLCPHSANQGYAEYIVNDIEPGILDFYEDIW